MISVLKMPRNECALSMRMLYSLTSHLIKPSRSAVQNKNSGGKVSGLTKKQFNGFLKSATKYYKQTDGVAMGSPLGPTLANIFLCYHEKSRLQQCPGDYILFATACGEDKTIKKQSKTNGWRLFHRDICGQLRDELHAGEITPSPTLSEMNMICGRQWKHLT